ncbi:MAG: polysaccharide biosynthesis C-terminal domain-containing protein, partial [Clostridia bacterium]|nr:polysaccharide biosynthesis C-terminal domain-containing protein [Clostridia bacterium]
VFIGIVVDQLNWSIDRLLLGWLHGTTAVTIYVQASQLNLYYLSLATVFSGVLTPRVHHMVAGGKSDRELSDLFARTGRLQFILMSMVLLGFVAVGQPFIVLWSGGDWNKFSVSYYIGLILFASTLLPAIQGVGIEIQRAKNMHKFRSLVYLGVALGNILFSLPLTMRWQGLGASIGTFVATFVGNVLLMNWYYHKRIGLDIPRFWREIAKMLPALVLPTGAAVTIAYFAPITSYLGVALWGAIFVVVFLPNMWLLGMNEYEKDLVRSAVRRALPKKRAS